jgi:hypothetical protein
LLRLEELEVSELLEGLTEELTHTGGLGADAAGKEGKSLLDTKCVGRDPQPLPAPLEREGSA